MRRTLALLMTSWTGILVAILVGLIEAMIVSGILTTLGIYGDIVWWIVILANSVFLGIFYWNWVEGLRKEGKAILAAKVDNDPEETVG